MAKAEDDEIAALLDLSYLSDDGKVDMAFCNTEDYLRLKHLLTVLPTLYTLEQLSHLCDQLAELGEFEPGVCLSNFSGLIDECKWSCICVAMIGEITRHNQIQVFHKISRIVRLMRKITLTPLMIDNVLKNTITHICQLANIAPVVRDVLQNMFAGGEPWTGVLISNKRIIQHCFEVWLLACTQQEQWHVLLAFLSHSNQGAQLFSPDETVSAGGADSPGWDTQEFRKARRELSVENCHGLRMPWVSALSLCHHLLDIGDNDTFWLLLPLLLAKPCSDELMVDRVWHRNLFEEKALNCNRESCVCHDRDASPYDAGVGVERSYQVLIRLDMLRTAGKVDTFSECVSGYGLDTLILRLVSHAHPNTREYVDDWLQDLENPQITTHECLKILNHILAFSECQLVAYQFLELCCRLAENYFVCDQGKLAGFIATFERSEAMSGGLENLVSETSPGEQGNAVLPLIHAEAIDAFRQFCDKQNYNCLLSEYFLLSVLETYESKCGVTSRIPLLNPIEVMVAPKALNLSDNLCESLLLTFYLLRTKPIATRPQAKDRLLKSLEETVNAPRGITPTLLPIKIAKIWSGYIITSSFKNYLTTTEVVNNARFDRWRTIMLEILVAACKGTYSPSNLVGPHLTDSLVDNFVRVYISHQSPRAVHLSRRYIGRFPAKITQHIMESAIPADNAVYIANVWAWSDVVSSRQHLDDLLAYLVASPQPQARQAYLDILAATGTESPQLHGELSSSPTAATSPTSAGSPFVKETDAELSPHLNRGGSGTRQIRSEFCLHRLSLLCQQRPVDWACVRTVLSEAVDDDFDDAEWLDRAYCLLVCGALRARHYGKALEFYEESVKRNCRLDIDTCALLLQHVHFLIKVRPSAQMDRTNSTSLSPTADSASPSASELELGTVVSAADSPTSAATRSLNLREELISLARRLDPHFTDCHLLSAVVEALSKAREFDRIAAIVNEFMVSHPKPTPLALATVVKAYGRCGKKEEVLRLWSSISRNCRDEFIQGCLIDALVFIGEFDEALQLWQFCMKNGLKLGEPCQSVLIRGCVTRNRFNEAMTVYRSMLSRSIHPCDVTCNYLMHGCTQLGRLDDALQCFNDMSNWSSPDIVSYSTIIKGLCDKHKVEMAYEVFFLKMEEAGLVADIVTYNTLLEGFGKVGNREMVESLHKQLIDRGLQPTCYTLTILIKFYGKLKLLNKVFAAYNDMPKEFGFECDQFVYTSVIAACTWNKRLDLAHEVLLTMRKKFTVSSRTYSTVIAGCIKMSAWEILAELLYLCIQDEIPLNRKDLNKLENILKTSLKGNAAQVEREENSKTKSAANPASDSCVSVSQIRLFHALLSTLRESCVNGW